MGISPGTNPLECRNPKSETTNGLFSPLYYSITNFIMVGYYCCNMARSTQATTDEMGLMDIEAEALAYEDGAWDCEVSYVSEGSEEEAPHFYLDVDGDSIPSGLLMNLQDRGYTIKSVSSFDECMRLTASL